MASGLEEEFSESCLTSSDVNLDERELKKKSKQEYKPPPLPEPLNTWRKLLKDIWSGEEPKVIKHELCQTVLNEIFDGNESPLESLLALHKSCPDFGSQKLSSLAGFVLKHFRHWVEKNDRLDEINATLNLSLKVRAFAIATSKHTTHLEMIASIFNLNDGSMQGHVINAVKKMIKSSNHRDAIACATFFNLQSYFTLEELIIPCMFQDRFEAVKDYVVGHPQLQENLVRHFDDLIAVGEKAINCLCKEYRERGIMTMSASKVQKKALEKLVSKMLVAFNLPSGQFAPNLSRCRQQGALRHIAYKFFIEKAITEEGYHDYVAHALSHYMDLQHYFVGYLTANGWPEDAVRWVIYCDMHQVPHIVVRYLKNRTLVEKAKESILKQQRVRANISNVELFEGHSIKMVDSANDLIKLASAIRNADLVGIDSEWKPLFMCTNDQIAIFQVSLKDCSYLVDAMTLQERITETSWIDFFDALFCSDKSIKLGFDFSNDLRVFRSSFPFLQSMHGKMKQMTCVMKLVNSLLSVSPAFITMADAVESLDAADHDTSNTSSSDEIMHFRLTDLCERILGQPLDKREQIGNWAIRPLRLEQMKYAAMDSYCLLEIYEKLKAKAESCGLDWQMHLDASDIIYPMKAKEKKGKKKSNKFDEEEFKCMINRVNADIEQSTMRVRKPKDLKVIVDSMMLGLGKHLRRCGIDTLLADSREYLIECAKKDALRYILTCGKASDELRRNRQLRGLERILCIPVSQKGMMEQIEFVLRHFNVHLSKDDIFSRCMNCNSDSFVIAPSPVLQAIYQLNVVAMNPFNDETFDMDELTAKMSQLDPAKYSGFGCELTTSKSDSSCTTAQCSNGFIDLEKGLVFASDRPSPVEIMIEKLPPSVFEKEGRFFYICGECGKIYWDGCQITNYNTFVGSLFSDEA